MKKNSGPLLYDQKDGVAYIRINRPDTKNAINSECWQLFEEYFQSLLSASHIRALVITGVTPDIFSAGVDVHPSDPLISKLFTALQEKNRQTILEGISYMQNILCMLASLPFPSIAAINGLCYSGGLELALALEKEQAAINILSSQCIEGISAFLEKRAPKWQA